MKRLVPIVLLLAGCQLPVTPWARFTAYSLPYYNQGEFEKRFNAWKGKGGTTWTIRYRASSMADNALLINSEGPSTFGPRGTGTAFTPTRAELVKLVDELLASKIFDLYDGHYGAYDQGGGLIGPEIHVTIGGLKKQLSYDEDLAASWEAGALKRASEALRNLGLKYIESAAAKDQKKS